MSLRADGRDNADGRDIETVLERTDQTRFKKLKRPAHAHKRPKTPERTRGIHRRRKKRINW